MEWDFTALAVVSLIVGFGLGYIIFPIVFDELSDELVEPVVDDGLLQDNLNYCKGALTEERSVAKELWDDYWDCLLSVWCEDDLEFCLELYPNFSQEELLEDLNFKKLNCYYAENYDQYFERYE